MSIAKKVFHTLISLSLLFQFIPAISVMANPKSPEPDRLEIPQTPGPTFYRTITVNAGQVPSTLTDFPILISISNDAALKSAGNGGHVANTDGSDIFFTDTTGTAQYPFEIEKYDPVTGTLAAWVKLPTVADGTQISLRYGGDSVSNTPSGVWTNGYQGVWHMKEVNAADSTVNCNDGVASGGVTSNDAGKIDGDVNFDNANTGLIDCGNATTLDFDPSGTYTWEAWVNPAAAMSGGEGIIGKFNGSNDSPQGYEINISGGSSKFRVQTNTNNVVDTQLNSNTIITFGNWYHVAVVWNTNSSVSLYVNGVLDNSMAMVAQGNTADDLIMGFRKTGNHYYGQIDEVRYSTVARSVDWLKAEYNNQAAPGAFASVGDEAVDSGALDHIVVSPANPVVSPGAQLTFTAQGYDSADNTVSGTYTWACTNSTAGTIDPVTGVFTAGTTVGTYAACITATSGAVSGATSIAVTAAAVDHIVVTPANPSVFRLGHRTFAAQGYDTSNNPISGLTYTWECTNPAAGSINAGSGYFTAGTTLGAFSNVITATAGGVTGTASVNVAIWTWYVEPTGGTDIQNAINIASSGDTIIVRDGTYNENIVVDKSLTIRSQNGPAGVIIHPATTSANIINVNANNVTIDGLTLSGSDTYTGDGIKSGGVEYGIFINNIISGVNVGIRVTTALEAGKGHHIISRNTIAINNTPINLLYMLIDSAAIVVDSSSYNTVTDNVCIGPAGAADSKGIMLFSPNYTNVSQGDVVAGNTCTGFTCGLKLQQVKYVNIYRNTFANNSYGIYLRQNGVSTVTKYNNFYLNNVTGSTTANIGFLYYTLIGGVDPNYGTEYPTDNYWNSAASMNYIFGGSPHTGFMGNYWGGTDGMDTNGDGIGDTPYQIRSTPDEFDAYPLMAPYSSYVSNPQAPVAGFGASVTSGPAPLTVVFADQSTGNVTSWAWDFDNNGTTDSTLRRPTYTYSSPGLYNVRLVVTNAFGATTLVKTGFIAVAVPTFTITATAAPHVSITPSGTITVVSGSSQMFTIEADPGYAISNVLVDGLPVGPVASYTFIDVRANHRIAVYPADTIAPTWPDPGSSSSIDFHNAAPYRQVTMNWSGATDDTAVTQFRVYMKNGTTNETTTYTVPAIEGNPDAQGSFGITLPTYNTDTTYYFKVQAGDPSDNWSADFNYLGINHEPDGWDVFDGASAISTPSHWPDDAYLKATNIGTPEEPEVLFQWSQPVNGTNGGEVWGYTVRAASATLPPPGSFIDSVNTGDENIPQEAPWRNFANRTYIWTGDNPHLNVAPGSYTNEGPLFPLPEPNKPYYFAMWARNWGDDMHQLGPVVHFDTAWSNSPLMFTTAGSMNMPYPPSTLTYAQATGPASKQTYYGVVDSPTDPSATFFRLGSAGNPGYPVVAANGILPLDKIQLIDKATGETIPLTTADPDGLAAYGDWAIEPGDWSAANGAFYGYKLSAADGNGDDAYLDIHLPSLAPATTYVLTLKSALTSNFNGADYAWEFTTGNQTQNTFTINASAGTNGSISPSGAVAVNSGDSQTFDIISNSGYRVADVTIDGASQGPVTSYTFSDVTSSHTISATFMPNWSLNNDRVCNIGDVVVIGLHWGETGTPGWILSDVNKDSRINIGDVVVIGLHWGETW